MNQPEEWVAAVLAAADGELVGRIRFQKVVYLLDQLGFGSGFDFYYHNYGPYSQELDRATDDAKAIAGLKEKFEHRASDGAMYSIYEWLPPPDVSPHFYGTLGPDRARELLDLFKRTPATILELAATAHFIAVREKNPNWEAEVRKRKRLKTEKGRLERAVGLLRELELPPGVAA